MNSLIQKEMDKGIDPSKIFLCGFSQGAGIAIRTACERTQPIGGVIAFCGCLPNHDSFSVTESAKHMPLMCVDLFPNDM